MTTATQASTQAAIMAMHLEQGPRMLGIPAPSSVSHSDYAVGYYNDGSALIWTRHDGYIVVPSVDSGYRENLEHAARCMGMWPAEKRAEMVGPVNKWIDGVHWSSDGRFLEI